MGKESNQGLQYIDREMPSKGDTLLGVFQTYMLLASMVVVGGESVGSIVPMNIFLSLLIGGGGFVTGVKTLNEWRRYHK